MTEIEADKEFLRGVLSLHKGDTLAGLVCFEKAAALADRPVYLSFLGYCLAKERGQVQKGMHLCTGSLELEPENPVHYLNLGRIYLLAGNKTEAIDVFRKGLTYGPEREIASLLESIGTRRPPVIGSLSRRNPINKYLGKLLCRVGFRKSGG